MLKRFLTGIVILTLIVGAFALRYVNTYLFDIFAGIIILCSTFEVSRVFEKNNKKIDKLFVLAYPVLIYGALLLSIHTKLSLLVYLAITICLSLAILFACFIKNLLTKTRNNKDMVEANYNGNINQYIKDKLKNDLIILFYPAFILSLLFLVNHIADFVSISDANGVTLGMMLLIMIFATTMITDTGAYVIGCGLRGKKLCPKISPNKTISGAIGGLVCSIATSIILFAIFNSIPSFLQIINTFKLSIWAFVIYGFIASIVSQIGDLFASYIKRQNNVKDYGSIFPGHGGFMDRVDGIAFNLVFTIIFAICFML